MEDTFKIHLYIADERFSVELPKNDEAVEQLYRDAAKRIDRLLSDYRLAYREGGTFIDTKRLLAMVALHLSKQLLQTETRTDDSRCLAQVADLDKELEAFLSK